MVRNLTIQPRSRPPLPPLRLLPLLQRAGHQSASLVRGLFEELGPVSGGLLLIELLREDGQTQAALARALGVRKASLTLLVQDLVDHQLVREVPHPADRRARGLWLTRAGRCIAGIGYERLVMVEARIAATLLPADLQALQRISDAIAAARLAPGDVT